MIFPLSYYYQDIYLLVGSKYYGKEIDTKAYNFSLKDTDGNQVRLSSYLGKYVYLFFGFTSCTDICPIMMSNFVDIGSKIQSKKINYLFITIDPIRDNAKAVKEFVSKFDVPNLKGLLSGKDSVHFVSKKYVSSFNYYEKKAEQDVDYQVEHAGFIYLIDPKGNIKFVYPHKDLNIDKLVKDFYHIEDNY